MATFFLLMWNNLVCLLTYRCNTLKLWKSFTTLLTFSCLDGRKVTQSSIPEAPDSILVPNKDLFHFSFPFLFLCFCVFIFLLQQPFFYLKYSHFFCNAKESLASKNNKIFISLRNFFLTFKQFGLRHITTLEIETHKRVS